MREGALFEELRVSDGLMKAKFNAAKMSRYAKAIRVM